MVERKRRSRLWTPDRGDGFYQIDRDKAKRPSLVETGYYSGRSRIRYVGVDIWKVKLHMWIKDFYTSIANVPFWWVLCVFLIIYILVYLFWACVWFIVYKIVPECIDLSGPNQQSGYISAFIFAIVTQQTIGYGDRGLGSCWVSAWTVLIQTVLAMALDSFFLGVVFAKLSHPQKRGRTIFISDSAVIARRDGVLKLMFRVGDVREYPVIDARIRGALYVWGSGRTTAEGEHIPARVQTLNISYYDQFCVLPATCEHVIDERSPLFGHTRQSLDSLQAEIVVSLEGTNEFGDTFSARQSYVPQEIHWGHVFVPIIKKAISGTTRHIVDLSSFHEVMPQQEFATYGQFEASRQLAQEGVVRSKTAPYPTLGENTLIISDTCVLNTSSDGTYQLKFRVGDVYMYQMTEARVRAYFYQWDQPTNNDLYSLKELDVFVGDRPGHNRLMLRVPQTVVHNITQSSPLFPLTTPNTLHQTTDQEILVIVESQNLHTSSSNVRTITYTIPHMLLHNHEFKPCVIPPKLAARAPPVAPIVNWNLFHETYDQSKGPVDPRSMRPDLPEIPAHAPPGQYAYAAEIHPFQPGAVGGGGSQGVGASSGAKSVTFSVSPRVYGQGGWRGGGGSRDNPFVVEGFEGEGGGGVRFVLMRWICWTAR